MPFPSEVLTGSQILRGAENGDKFYLFENKGKTNATPARKSGQKIGTLGFPSVTVSLPVVAQPCPAKSRIIPNRRCKSKKAKENWLVVTKAPVLDFALFRWL